MNLDYIKINNPKETIKKLIIYFYVYMVIEGMLRKWFIPILNKEIYFIKDFFLLIIYFIAFRYNFFIKTKFSKIFLILIIFLTIYGFIGYGFEKNSILLFIFGIRSYFLFVPLFLIIFHVFKFEDIQKFAKTNLYFIFPYYILIIIQTNFSYQSYINSGFQSIVQNPERPSAYFTYITQNTYYFLFLVCCNFSYLLNCKHINKKNFYFILVLNFMLAGILILLKSRSVYIYFIAILIYSIFFTFISRNSISLKIKKLILLIVIIPIFFSINSLIFKKEFKFSSERINTDTYQTFNFLKNQNDQNNLSDKVLKNVINIFINNEITSLDLVYNFCSKNSSICRIFNEIYFLPSISEASTYGYGIGSGTPIVTSIKKEKTFIHGEAENHRIIIELGYFIGASIVLLKYLFVFVLNINFFLNKKVKNKLFFAPFLVFISVAFTIGPITYTTSFISFICWFSLGLIMTLFDKNEEKI